MQTTRRPSLFLRAAAGFLALALSLTVATGHRLQEMVPLPSAAALTVATGHRLQEMVPLPSAAAMPNPAFALRTEANVEAGLEDLNKALRNPDNPLEAAAEVLTQRISKAIGIPPGNPAAVPAAGLEENPAALSPLDKLSRLEPLINAVLSGLAQEPGNLRGLLEAQRAEISRIGISFDGLMALVFSEPELAQMEQELRNLPSSPKVSKENAHRLAAEAMRLSQLPIAIAGFRELAMAGQPFTVEGVAFTVGMGVTSVNSVQGLSPNKARAVRIMNLLPSYKDQFYGIASGLLALATAAGLEEWTDISALVERLKQGGPAAFGAAGRVRELLKASELDPELVARARQVGEGLAAALAGDPELPLADVSYEVFQIASTTPIAAEVFSGAQETLLKYLDDSAWDRRYHAQNVFTLYAQNLRVPDALLASAMGPSTKNLSYVDEAFAVGDMQKKNSPTHLVRDSARSTLAALTKRGITAAGPEEGKGIQRLLVVGMGGSERTNRVVGIVEQWKSGLRPTVLIGLATPDPNFFGKMEGVFDAALLVDTSTAVTTPFSVMGTGVDEITLSPTWTQDVARILQAQGIAIAVLRDTSKVVDHEIIDILENLDSKVKPATGLEEGGFRRWMARKWESLWPMLVVTGLMGGVAAIYFRKEIAEQYYLQFNPPTPEQATITPSSLYVQFPPETKGMFAVAYLQTDLYYPQVVSKIDENGRAAFHIEVRQPNRPGWVRASDRRILVFPSSARARAASREVRDPSVFRNLDPAAILTISPEGKVDLQRFPPAAGLEEAAEVRVMEVPSAVEAKKVLILAPEALRMLRALAWLKPADGQPIPLVALAENPAQAEEVRNWTRNLMLEAEVIDLSAAPYEGNVPQAVQMISRYYASERGLTPLVARDLEDLLAVAKFLGAPEPESFVRAAEAEISGQVEQYL